MVGWSPRPRSVPRGTSLGPAAQEENITPMRRPFPIAICVLLIALTGCSSTGSSRFTANPGSRSIAVVGDRPMPATSGEPGTQVAAEAPDPEPRRNPKARISGRVVDDQGRPASGITVRLADGGVKGGKDIRATTDRSGAFTLNGLRPGSAYSLVAESDDDRGRLSGRAEAEASDTGVEICLAGADETNPPRNRSGRASRAKPISSREASDGPLEGEEASSMNREDLRPADEADDPDVDRRPGSSRPRLSAPEPAVGWRKKSSTTKEADPSEGDVESVASSASEEAPSRPRRPSASEIEPEEEDFNPLPPAINRRRDAPTDDGSNPPQTSSQPNPGRKVSDRAGSKPSDLGTLALATESPDDRILPTGPQAGDPGRKIDASELPQMPPILPEMPAAPRSIEVAGDSSLVPGPDLAGHDESGPGIAPGAVPRIDPPPIASADPPGVTPSPPMTAQITQVASTNIPASEPVFASTTPKVEVAPTLPTGQDYNPFLLVSPSSPAPVSPSVKSAGSPPPATESEVPAAPPRKKWGDLASVDRPNVAVETTRPTSSLMKRIRGTADRKDVSLSLCSYDPRLRKIVDFRLPDLEGKPVQFQDLDADFILLDFWGTWCAPCLESIPHLVALQKEYGPRRLRVVGIACEKAPPDQRKARVEEASRRLGINYAILLSGTDGKPCPVQESLQIQAYPTTILLDRTGRILWRNTGATPAAQERLDRVLAGLSRSDSVRR
jgi:thiol-disulfide isomerase/thioredoxin